MWYPVSGGSSDACIGTQLLSIHPAGTGSIDAVAINCDAVESVFIGAGADGILDVRIVGVSEMRMCLGHMESSFQRMERVLE